MASLSYVAILLILTFITPATPIWLIFRTVIPKTRTINFTDSLIVLTCCFVTLVLNGHHIYFYAALLTQKLIELNHFTGPVADFFNLALVDHKLEYWRYLRIQFFWQWLFNWKPQSLDLGEFIFDLHLRTTIFGLFGYAIFRFLGFVERSAQVAPYKKDYPDKISRADKFFLWLCGVTSKDVPIKYEKKKIKLRFLTKIKETIYHPWAILTEWNHLREVLMVDVVTLDDCLFSGILSTWVPGKNDVSAIALEYSLKYYKDGAEKKQKLIPNNGELIISSSQIKTLHFWEIRKGTQFSLLVENLYDCERWKWNLLLMYLYPDFVEKVTVVVVVGDKFDIETVKKIKVDIKTWMNQIGIKFGSDKHTVVYEETE